MMLSLICEDMLYKILNYLDSESLRNFDTALLNKEERLCLMNIFSKYDFGNISACKWTYLRNFNCIKQFCRFNNLSFISPQCKHVTIYYKNGVINGHKEKYQVIKIDNDILESIHIDFEKSYHVGVESIKGANIKSITIACARNISNIFLNIRENCPKLQKIRLMYTDVSSDVIQKNPDINIIYLKQI